MLEERKCNENNNMLINNDIFIIINKFRKKFEIFVQVSAIKLIFIVLLTMKIKNTLNRLTMLFIFREKITILCKSLKRIGGNVFKDRGFAFRIAHVRVLPLYRGFIFRHESQR